MCMFLKTGIRKYVALFLAVSMVLCMFTVVQPAYAAATTANVTVNANVTGNKISQLLIGGFSEDLHLEVDGGFYAEKVFNRSFEFNSGDGAGYNTPLAGWTQVNRNGGTGTITVENSSPLNSVNTHYVHINVTNAGSGVGLSNSGWYGLSTVAGTTYNYSIYAKRGANFSSSLTLEIDSQGGTNYGTATVSSLTTDWVKYTGSITANTTDQNAQLVVVANGTGDVYLDFISLFPSTTFKNRPNGIRNDIGTALEELHYKFIRFPGGCIIHQYTYQYNWKDQIGPVEGRKEYPNTAWNTAEPKEHISNGFGMYEWLQLCEDIGAVAVPCLPVGAKCGGGALDPASAEMAQLTQDTLDFVEFCNGDAATTWGAKRAAMGHPAPFNIQYLGLGNEENDTPNLRADLAKIYNAVHEAYPSLNLINTAFWVGQENNGYDFNASLDAYGSDAHYYFNRGSLSWIDFINSYNRSYPQVILGEYGSNTRNGELEDAIDTARDKAVFEKNGDILSMSSWTLLRKVIDFDNANVFKTANYHVDKMWSENLADYNVQFKQSGDSNLVVVAGKDAETGDLILKLINNSANDISSTVAINGMSDISPTADVTYVKPITPGNRAALDSYLYNGIDKGYSVDRNEISTGKTTATVSSNQLTYSSPAYSMAVVRVHGNISSTHDTIYEAENFNGGAAITSGRVKTAVKELNTSSSDFWSRADLQGVNEFIQYNDVNVAAAGIYNVKVGIKKDTNRAITQLSIDGADQGSPIDQYDSTAVNQEVDLGTVILSGGRHTFKFKVTDKNPASSSYTSAVDYILLNDADNFNTMSTGSAPLGWTLDTSGGTVTVQEVPSSADKSVLMSKSDAAAGRKTSMLKTFNPLSGIVTIEAKVKRDTTANVWYLPNIYSSDGTMAESVIFDNGDIKAYNGGIWQTVQPFTADTWYTLKLIINTDTDLFDLYIDGVKKVDQLTLGNAVTDISKIEFYAADGNTGDTYVDIENDPYSFSEATLSGLAISKGTLSPTFTPGIMSYNAGTVANNVSSIDITPTVTSSAYRSLTVNGAASASGAVSNVSLAEGENIIPVVVTAQDGTIATYTIVITRAVFQSSDAALSGLVISQGTLSPAFGSGTRNYKVLVGNNVSTIDITPTANSAVYRTLTVNGAASASGTVSSVNLTVGLNSIPVVVTAQDGTTAAYTIDITREVTPSTANFNTMTTGSAPLGWNLDTSAGTVTVQEVPSAADKSVLISKTGNATGSKTTMYKVLDPLSGIVTIEAKVRREAAGSLWCLPYTYGSDGAIAVSIQFDNGNIKVYNGGWQTIQPYTAGTWYTLKEVIDTDTDKFDLYIDGVKKVTQGVLRSAVTDISKIEFYAADFNTGNTYVDIDNQPFLETSDATLSNLTISQGTLSPIFTPDTKNYTATVANNVSSIDITPTANSSGYRSLTVNGVPSSSGAISSVSLVSGENSIPVAVTAQDGTIATYTIDVTRLTGLSSDATLSNLVISQGTLSPIFTSGTRNYTASVTNSVSSIDITPTLALPSFQSLTVNGAASVSGAVSTVALKVGENSIPVAVTAQDGTIATYTMVITRHSTDNFNLMTTGNAPLGWTTTFAGAGTITVQDDPSAADKSVLISKTGGSIGNKTSMSKTFTPLSGIVAIETKIKRTATGALWCLPYTYSSTNAQAVCVWFDTGNIKAYNGGWQTLQPFAANQWYTLKYVINTSTGKYDMYIDGTRQVTNGSLRGAATDISKIEFYAADANTGSAYVDMEIEPYLFNTLSSLEISQGTLSPAFAPDIMNYEASVANNVSSIDITPTWANSSDYKSMLVNGADSELGAVSSVNLAVGVNSIPVVLTAQDNTTTTYTINITRAAAQQSSDATLSGLEISEGTLSPTFTSDTRDYTASVANSVSSIDVTPTVTSSVYQSLTVNGVPAESGEANSVELAAGVNNIPVVVTAEDGTVATYTISVTRAAEQTGDVRLSNLEISPGTLSPAFTPDNMLYETSVANDVTSVEITPEASEYGSLSVNGVPTVSGAAISVALAVGVNNIPVVVTAQDDTASTYIISVTREAAKVIPVTGITVTPSTVSDFRVGSAAQQLAAEVTPGNATNTNVLWNSSNSLVAAVSASGVITAVGPGTAIIKATSVSNNDIFGECTVTVLPAEGNNGGNNDNGGNNNNSGNNNNGGNNNNNGNSNNGSNNGNDTLEVTPVPAVSSKLEVKPVLGPDKSAKAAAGINDLQKAIGAAEADSAGNKTITVNVARVEGADRYILELPKSILAADTAAVKVKIETPMGTIVAPGNMLKTGEISGSNVQLTIGFADNAALNGDLKQSIGSRPVIEVNASVDGRDCEWSSPEAPITVSMDYKPTDEELANPEHITVWCIDRNGNTAAVPSGRYNPATGQITFTTTYMGRFAVAYVNKTFSDIGRYSWAKNKIEVMAAKGIIEGTAETTYEPEQSIKRADFIKFLVKALGLSAEIDGNFGDVKTGSYYYEAVGIAKKLGITKGVGDNKFDPLEPISRQDMMVLVEKALKIAGKPVEAGSDSDLAAYKDAAKVSGYAADAAAALIKDGIIRGSNNMINPKAQLTRAEAAVVIYNLYNK